MKDAIYRFFLVIHWLGFLLGVGGALMMLYVFVDEGIIPWDYQALIGSPLVGAGLFIGLTAIGWVIRFIIYGKIHFLPWK